MPDVKEVEAVPDVTADKIARKPVGGVFTQGLRNQRACPFGVFMCPSNYFQRGHRYERGPHGLRIGSNVG